MNDLSTLSRVKALIGDAAGLPADDIGDDMPLGPSKSPITNGEPRLDLDSLDRLELIIAFSEHFGIEIPDADADKPEMGTAAGIAAYIDERLRAAEVLGAVAETIDIPMFAMSTGDPRFGPNSPLTINGFRFEPVITPDPTAPPHVQRMQIERAQLASRFEKLAAFMGTDTFHALSEVEQGLMLEQCGHMEGYLGVLDRRLSHG